MYIMNDKWKQNTWYAKTSTYSKNTIKALLPLIEQKHETNPYEEPTRIHENSIFIYKSQEATFAMKSRFSYVVSLFIVPAIAWF